MTTRWDGELVCSEHELVFDEVISCDLPPGHDGPHKTVVIDDNAWHKVRTTWSIQWQTEPLAGKIQH